MGLHILIAITKKYLSGNKTGFYCILASLLLLPIALLLAPPILATNLASLQVKLALYLF